MNAIVKPCIYGTSTSLSQLYLRENTRSTTAMRHLVPGIFFFFFFFFKVFGGHMSIFGATGTPVLDFW